HGPPDPRRLMRDLSEMVNQRAAKPAADQRSDSDRQEGETHVRALLPGRSEARNVFVVARRLNDLAKRQHKQRKHGAPERRPQRENYPREGSDHGAQNHGLKCRNPAGQVIYRQREADHGEAIGHQDDLNVGLGIDITVNVAGQTDVLLPEHYPVAGEEYEEPHEAADSSENEDQKTAPDPPRHAVPGIDEQTHAQQQSEQQYRQNQTVVADYNAEIPRDGGDRRRRRVSSFARFAEKNDDHEEHGEDAHCGHAVNVFHAHVAMRPRGEIRAHGSADVHHGVVNRVADGADVFFGSPCRGADHARFHHRNAQRGQNQNASDKQSQRHRVAQRSQPRRGNRSDQEIGGGEDEVSQRKRAAKTEAIGGRSSKNGKKPDHAAEQAGKSSGLLGREIQLLLQVQSKRSERPIVGKALKDFGNVRDPEWPFEPGANFLQAFRKGQSLLPIDRVARTLLPATRR